MLTCEDKRVCVFARKREEEEEYVYEENKRVHFVIHFGIYYHLLQTRPRSLWEI